MRRQVKLALGIAAFVILAGSIVVSVLYCTTIPEGLSSVASVATLIGLAYTGVQIWETKNLTRATKVAADKAVLEMRTNEYRYALLFASRLMGEIRVHIQNKSWKLAGLRLHDLAEQCLSLSRVQPGVDDQWRQFARVARFWGSEFDEGRTNRSLEYDSTDWRRFYDDLCEKVDRESQPFSEDESE